MSRDYYVGQAPEPTIAPGTAHVLHDAARAWGELERLGREHAPTIIADSDVPDKQWRGQAGTSVRNFAHRLDVYLPALSHQPDKASATIHHLARVVADTLSDQRRISSDWNDVRVSYQQRLSTLDDPNAKSRLWQVTRETLAAKQREWDRIGQTLTAEYQAAAREMDGIQERLNDRAAKLAAQAESLHVVRNDGTAITVKGAGAVPIGPAAPQLSGTLYRSGSRGSDVRAIQEFLVRSGANIGTVDGDYGPKTAAAVTSWQQERGLAATGAWDLATQGAALAGAGWSALGVIAAPMVSSPAWVALEALTTPSSTASPGVDAGTVSAPAPEPAPVAPPPPVTPEPIPLSVAEAAACTRDHESRGDYTVVSADGKYHGAYQFTQSTWDSTVSRMGREDLIGVPPEQASPADQDAAFVALWDDGKGAGHWGGRCTVAA